MRSSIRCARARVGASLLILVASGATVGAASSNAQRAQASGATLTYDQIARVFANATPPPPDSFAADAARIASLPPAPNGDKIAAGYETLQTLSKLSMIPGAALVMFPAMIAVEKGLETEASRETAAGKAYVEAGSLQHVLLSRGWSRTDFAGRHSSLIAKPDEGVLVWLDLAKHTYRETRTAPSTPGEETYVISASDDVRITFSGEPATASVGSMTVAGIPARGYQTDAAFAMSGSLGFCGAGPHVLREIEYVANDVPDPQASAGPALAGSTLDAKLARPRGWDRTGNRAGSSCSARPRSRAAAR